MTLLDIGIGIDLQPVHPPGWSQFDSELFWIIACLVVFILICIVGIAALWARDSQSKWEEIGKALRQENVETRGIVDKEIAKLVTYELFESHKAHLDERFTTQDKMLAQVATQTQQVAAENRQQSATLNQLLGALQGLRQDIAAPRRETPPDGTKRGGGE